MANEYEALRDEIRLGLNQFEASLEAMPRETARLRLGRLLGALSASVGLTTETLRWNLRDAHRSQPFASSEIAAFIKGKIAIPAQAFDRWTAELEASHSLPVEISDAIASLHARAEGSRRADYAHALDGLREELGFDTLFELSKFLYTAIGRPASGALASSQTLASGSLKKMMSAAELSGASLATTAAVRDSFDSMTRQERMPAYSAANTVLRSRLKSLKVPVRDFVDRMAAEGFALTQPEAQEVISGRLRPPRPKQFWQSAQKVLNDLGCAEALPTLPFLHDWSFVERADRLWENASLPGEKLGVARGRFDFSQAAFAKLLGSTNVYLNQLEKAGDKFPGGINRWTEIIDALNAVEEAHVARLGSDGSPWFTPDRRREMQIAVEKHRTDSHEGIGNRPATLLARLGVDSWRERVAAFEDVSMGRSKKAR